MKPSKSSQLGCNTAIPAGAQEKDDCGRKHKNRNLYWKHLQIRSVLSNKY